MQIKDANLSLMIKDMDKSVAFYLSIGFTLKNRYGNHYTQLSSPGLTIGLHPTHNELLTGNSGNASIGLTSDNIEETRLELEKLNIIAQLRTEEGGQFLHFTDPDGTALYFIKPKW